MRMRGKKPIFSRSDTYDLVSVMERLIVAGLKAFLRDTETHPFAGCPMNIYWELFGEEYPQEGYSPEQDAEASALWRKRLRFIVDSLEAEEPLYMGKWDHGPDHGKEGLPGFTVWNMVPTDQEAYDRVKEETEQWDKNRKEALRLFAQHFDNLWI